MLLSQHSVKIFKCVYVHVIEGDSNPSFQIERWPLQAQPSPQRLFPRQSIPQWEATPTSTQAPPTSTESFSCSLQAIIPKQKGVYPSICCTVLRTEISDWKICCWLQTCDQSLFFLYILNILHGYVNVSCVRLEEWKQGRLTLTPHILLIHMTIVVQNEPIKSQYSVLVLVLRVHLLRVSSPSMLTGWSLLLLLIFSFSVLTLRVIIPCRS